jgi:hypothetical protein
MARNKKIEPNASTARISNRNSEVRFGVEFNWDHLVSSGCVGGVIV